MRYPSNSQILLGQAAQHGHTEVVRLLLARDDVNANLRDPRYQTPLSHAAKIGYEAVVALLLDRHDVNADLVYAEDGQTPLSFLDQSWDRRAWSLLCARDQDTASEADEALVADDNFNEGYHTPLSYAAMNGHEAIVKLLLARDDVSVNWKDEYHCSPLSLAAERGHGAVVKLLISRDDVNINSTDVCGQTPLASAAWFRREAVVKLLLARDDININLKDKNGKTPLYLAASSGADGTF